MTLSDIRLPNLDLSASQRETLEKYLPLVIIAVLAWFVARGLRKMFWMTFAMFWAFGGWHGILQFLR